MMPHTRGSFPQPTPRPLYGSGWIPPTYPVCPFEPPLETPVFPEDTEHGCSQKTPRARLRDRLRRRSGSAELACDEVRDASTEALGPLRGLSLGEDPHHGLRPRRAHENASTSVQLGVHPLGLRDD